MTVREWFSFQGRLRRQDWWLFYVLVMVVLAVVSTGIDVALGLVVVKEVPEPDIRYPFERHGIGPFGLASAVASVWGGLAGSVKRWHDRGKSGWWVLIALVPLIGQMIALVSVGFLRGTRGPNRFGPDPVA